MSFATEYLQALENCDCTDREGFYCDPQILIIIDADPHKFVNYKFFHIHIIIKIIILYIYTISYYRA